MIFSDIRNYTRGWFIGNFEPCIYKTDKFEVGLLSHKKGEKWPKHIHKIATEYNLLIKGLMTIGDAVILPGQIFTIEPGEVADPEFLEDCVVLVVKVPSVPGDKYAVD